MTELTASSPPEESPAEAERRIENAGYASASPLVFQYRVLKAIVLRELAARNGQYRMGYLVSILTPIATISLIMLMFGFRGKVIPTDFPMSVFVITGYPLWLGFQGLYSKSMAMASRQDPLLMFPQITQLDLVLAAVILEWATNTVIFFIMCLGAIVIFHADGPVHPLGVIFCFWGCMWMGAAVGLILCGLMRAAPLAAQFLNMFMRFGMWFSGVLYSVNRLPSFLWPYLQWNPLLHLIEGCRKNWNPDFDAPIYNPGFVIAVGFVLTTLGFVIERISRKLVA